MAPARRSDATIDRALRAARIGAMPAAIAAAGDEADALVDAAGLGTGQIVGIRRDSFPIACCDPYAGCSKPGRRLARIPGGRRAGRWSDGTTKRVSRSRHLPPYRRPRPFASP